MHLLSALTLETSSRANGLFRLNERFPEEVARMRAMKVSSETRNLPLATDCKRVLAYAAQEADRLGHYWINTDHLVLGILRDHENAAAARLEASGLQIEQANTQVSSSGRERGNYFFPSAFFWRLTTPANIVGQIAAATYVLLIVLLLGIVTEKSC